MTFEKYGSIPDYNEENVLNGIIKKTLIKNINMIIFLIILSIIFTSISCFVSLYSEIIFDEVINTNINNLIVITILFSILFIIKNITNFIRNHLTIYINQKLDISIILSTYSKVILLPYCFYKNKKSAEILSRINDLSYLKNFISKIIVTIFLDSITFIISFVIMYTINKKILSLMIFIGIIYFLIIIIFNRCIRRNTIKNQENTACINNYIIESASLYETIKGINIENNIILKFSELYAKALNDLYHFEKINNIVLVLKEFITDIGMLLVSFLSFKLIMDGSMTVGNYMSVTLLFGYLILPIRNIVDMLNEYHYVKSAIKRGNDLLEYEDEKIYEEEKILLNGNIKIKNLSYTFNNKYYALSNINLFIKDGEKVLILGKSGGGKSTVLKILYKYYEIDRNMVYINNYDLCDYSLSDIRRKMIYISQNEMLFSGSIRDNIVLDRNISEIEFLNICKILHIDDIVKNNIMGYDYLIEEGGANLSGGQRQRIILARSLLKDSNVIMIDEGFNQIDIELEREILIDIFKYFYDKTFIIVSHRSENIDLYDRIIKINNGKITEIEERCK